MVAKRWGRKTKPLFVSCEPSFEHPGFFEAKVQYEYAGEDDHRVFPPAYGRTQAMARALALNLAVEILASEARDELQTTLRERK